MNHSAALDLPAHSLDRMSKFAAGLPRSTFAHLVALACRLDRSRANLARAKAEVPDIHWQGLDDAEADLACMWQLVETVMERRLS